MSVKENFCIYIYIYIYSSHIDCQTLDLQFKSYRRLTFSRSQNDVVRRCGDRRYGIRKVTNPSSPPSSNPLLSLKLSDGLIWSWQSGGRILPKFC
ncbi:hypothetical protein L3X38_043586 [Prunus dulcis]|uniref:Uncharacterized protein n=1 Tax=Prunus dulcis TaxID=3755 RepID=A0AAD4YMD8_PRUDU|nr:hypothetical protein L3X38_043586 [Prunus dulcis]